MFKSSFLKGLVQFSPGLCLGQAFALIGLLVVAFGGEEEKASPYDPQWGERAPLRRVVMAYDSAVNSAVNGERLLDAMRGLEAGTRLEIGEGSYSIDRYAGVDLQGREDCPIWITAVSGARVVITRPDASQNILNLGAGEGMRYVVLQGLEFTGGSHGLRLYDCGQVWVDRCRIHDVGDVGISANSRDTSHLYITRNEIWNTGGTGEGMYLGGNNASVVMSRSVIALNHVHDTLNGVTQGDGIEVKQGSWGNWIVGNHVHDCNYPCIVVYGSGGKPVNIVEGNVCYRSNDNTMQIQGECEVRNNLVMSATGSAFASQPHQGEPTGLRVVHNTFINRGTAVKLTGWGRGEDMQFANNVCYSKAGMAMRIMQGSGNAAFVGNVVVGEVSDGLSGFNSGRGLEDFVGVDWDGMQRDARPSARSMFRGVADEAYAVGVDLDGEARTPPHSAGCYR